MKLNPELHLLNESLKRLEMPVVEAVIKVREREREREKEKEGARKGHVERG